MKIKSFFLLTPALLGLCSFTAAQQTEQVNIVTTAVPFLRISPDARVGAMGETGIAASADANSQFYNVAKYPFASEKAGLGLTYTPWLRKLGLTDVYLASAAGYYQVDDNQVISGSLRYFSLGNLQLTDYNGNELSSVNPREYSVDAGYSRKLGEHLSIGLALRYIYSNIAGNSNNGSGTYKAGNAFAGDLGLYYTNVTETESGWSAGAVFSNLGSKISYSTAADQKNFLPANFGVGAGYTWITESVHKLSLNGELNKLLVPAAPVDGTEEDYRAYNQKGLVTSFVSSFDNKAMAFSLGGEYVYDNLFSIRAGYYSDTRSMGKRNYATAGIGLNYTFLGLNFSYLVPSGNGVTANPLSSTLRFSVLVNLSGAR